MLKNNFRYSGTGRTLEFVDVVNQIASLINGMTFDFGAVNGGKSIADVTQNSDGLNVDLTRLDLSKGDEFPSGSGQYKVLQLNGADEPAWDYVRAH